MTRAHSLANAKKWENVSDAERSKRMSKLAKIRHAKLTPEERKAISRKIVAAHKRKARERKQKRAQRAIK